MDTSVPTKPGRTTRRTLAVLVITLLSTVGLGMTAISPASASSDGCSYYNWGVMCQHVEGSGTWVSHVDGSFTVWRSGPICNWQVTAEFFDANSQWYSTSTSATHYGCWYQNWDYVGINAWMRPGFVCTSVRSNGAVVASRCAAIY